MLYVLTNTFGLAIDFDCTNCTLWWWYCCCCCCFSCQLYHFRSFTFFHIHIIHVYLHIVQLNFFAPMFFVFILSYPFRWFCAIVVAHSHSIHVADKNVNCKRQNLRWTCALVILSVSVYSVDVCVYYCCLLSFYHFICSRFTGAIIAMAMALATTASSNAI